MCALGKPSVTTGVPGYSAGAIDVVERFNDAFNDQDADAVMAMMTPDCVFEGTPPPDGTRHRGAAEVRAAFEEVFGASPGARFTTEEIFAAGERVVVRWRYDWVDPAGVAGHVRGVDVFRVEDGLVREKLAYVKG